MFVLGRFLRLQLLLFSLPIFFTLILCSSSRSSDLDDNTENSSLFNQFKEISTELSLYLDRVKYPEMYDQNPTALSKTEIIELNVKIQKLKTEIADSFQLFSSTQESYQNQKLLGRLTLLFHQIARYVLLVVLHEEKSEISHKEFQNKIKSFFDGTDFNYKIQIPINKFYNMDFLNLIGNLYGGENSHKSPFVMKLKIDKTSNLPFIIFLLNPNYLSEVLEEKIIKDHSTQSMFNLANYIVSSTLLKNYYEMYSFEKISINQIQFSDPQMQIISLSTYLSKINSLQSNLINKTYIEAEKYHSIFYSKYVSENEELNFFFLEILKILNPNLKNDFFIGDEPELKKVILDLKQSYFDKTFSVFSRLVSLLDVEERSTASAEILFIYSFQLSGYYLFGNSLTLTPDEKKYFNSLLNEYSVRLSQYFKSDESGFSDLDKNLYAESVSKILEKGKDRVQNLVLGINEILKNLDIHINSQKIDLDLLKETIITSDPSIVFSKNFQPYVDSLFEKKEWLESRNQFFHTTNILLKTSNTKYEFLKNRIQDFEFLNEEDLKKKWTSIKLTKSNSFKKFVSNWNFKNQIDMSKFLDFGFKLGFFNDSINESTTVSEFFKTYVNGESIILIYKNKFKSKQMEHIPIFKWCEENHFKISKENVNDIILNSNHAIMKKIIHILNRIVEANQNRKILEQDTIVSETLTSSLKMGVMLSSVSGFGLIYSDWLKYSDQTLSPYSLWRHINDEILAPSMLALIGYQLGKFILKFPLPKVSSFLKTFDYSVFYPIFGSKFSKFNKVILASIAADVMIQGDDVFIDRPRKEFFLDVLSKSNLIEESSLMSQAEVDKIRNQDLEMRNMFWMNRALDGVFLFGFSAGYIFYKHKLILPALRKDLQSLTVSLDKVGFTSHETVPYDDYIDLATESSINRLNEISSNSSEMLSQKMNLKRFLIKENLQIKSWFQREELKWKLLAHKNYYQFIDLGLKPGDWNPERIRSQYEIITNLYKSGEISRSDFIRKEESFRELWNILEPVLSLISENKLYSQAYLRVWTNVLTDIDPSFEIILKDQTRYDSKFYTKFTQEQKIGFEKVDINGVTILRPEAQQKLSLQEWENLRNLNLENTGYSHLVRWLWH